MAKPSAILSKIRVPRFGFPGLALTERDFRLSLLKLYLFQINLVYLFIYLQFTDSIFV